MNDIIKMLDSYIGHCDKVCAMVHIRDLQKIRTELLNPARETTQVNFTDAQDTVACDAMRVILAHELENIHSFNQPINADDERIAERAYSISDAMQIESQKRKAK